MDSLNICQICGKTFQCSGNLQKHAHTHRGNRQQMPLHLLERIKIIHKQDGSISYVCVICGENSPAYEYLVPHLASHLKFVNQLSCEICGMEFAEKKKYLMHSKTHGDKCSICYKEFVSRDEFQSHLERHYGPFYKCDMCAQGFLSQSNHAKHMAIQHLNKEPHRCPVCFENFKSKREIMAHVKGHGSSRELMVPHDLADRIKVCNKRYVCAICSLEYTKLSMMTSHLENHLQSKWQCHVCGSEFVKQLHLSNHHRTHTSSTLCPCPAQRCSKCKRIKVQRESKFRK